MGGRYGARRPIDPTQGAGRLTAPRPILICGHGAHSFKNVVHTDVRGTL